MEEHKENSRKLLQDHKHLLQEEMEKTNKKHKSALLLFYFANSLINFARRGIKPFADGTIIGIVSIIIRLFIILILMAIKQEVLFVVIGYVAIHLISFAAGKLLLKPAEEKLTMVAVAAQRIASDYLNNRSERFGLVGDCVFYDDGAVVNGNQISIGMRQECGEVSIYRKDVGEEYRIYYNRAINSDDTGISLNEKFASTQLDNKFGIIVEKGKEMDGMKFFSPSMQVKMIDTPEMLNFKQMTISENVFTAIIGETVPFPPAIDIFSWKPLSRHMKEIEKYCASVRKQADQAHETMMKIDFIRGN